MKPAMARVLRPAAVAVAAAALTLLGSARLAAVAQAQTSGIQIAGASAISPLVLSRGCNQVVATSPSGIPVAAIAALVQPASAIVSVWRFNNTTQTYQAGFFAGSNAPVDFTRTGAGAGGHVTEAYFVCVSQSATMLPS
jgi:hypothetical protein